MLINENLNNLSANTQAGIQMLSNTMKDMQLQIDAIRESVHHQSNALRVDGQKERSLMTATVHSLSNKIDCILDELKHFRDHMGSMDDDSEKIEDDTSCTDDNLAPLRSALPSSGRSLWQKMQQEVNRAPVFPVSDVPANLEHSPKTGRDALGGKPEATLNDAPSRDPGSSPRENPILQSTLIFRPPEGSQTEPHQTKEIHAEQEASARYLEAMNAKRPSSQSQNQHVDSLIGSGSPASLDRGETLHQNFSHAKELPTGHVTFSDNTIFDSPERDPNVLAPELCKQSVNSIMGKTRSAGSIDRRQKPPLLTTTASEGSITSQRASGTRNQ